MELHRGQVWWKWCNAWHMLTLTLITTPCGCIIFGSYSEWNRLAAKASSIFCDTGHPCASSVPMLKQWPRTYFTLCVGDAWQPWLDTTWSPGLNSGPMGEIEGREDCADSVSRVPFCGCLLGCTKTYFSPLFNHLCFITYSFLPKQLSLSLRGVSVDFQLCELHENLATILTSSEYM